MPDAAAPDTDHPGDAASLTLATRPASPAAEALVGALLAAVEGHERRRKARGEGTREALRLAVAALAGGVLLNAARAGSPGAWSWQRLATASFAGEAVTKRHFDTARATLTALGFVAERPAFTRFHDFGDGAAGMERHATRFAPTSALWSLAAQHGITLANAHEHFRRQRPTGPSEHIVIRELSRRDGQGKRLRGAPLPVPDTPEARTLAEGVVRFNAWIAGWAVEGCDPPVFWRGFTHSLAFGGRWYALGESYQGMPREDRRARLRIGGEPAAEVDVHASHLAILHGLLQRPLPPGDLYRIAPELPREAAKAWVTQTIGAGRPATRWSREAREAAGAALRGHRAKEAGRAILARYPFLASPAELVGCADTPALTSLRLQRVEADALTLAMERLMERGIPALPMHDGLILRRGDAAESAAVLRDAFAAVAGVCPVVAVRQA